jgi:hypothetical protein
MNTAGRVLKLKPKNLQISAFVDASYSIHDDCKGHTGMVLTLGGVGTVIACRSTKQKLVARSSTESELIAVDDAMATILWYRQLMNEIGFHQKGPTKLHQDNKSTMKIIEKGKSEAKTKHINNRYYFVKQCVEAKEIEIIHLPTELMIADILTKPLQGELFKVLSSKIQGEEYRGKVDSKK